MMTLTVKPHCPGRSLAALEAFCIDLAALMDNDDRARLAAALHAVSIEARAALELAAETHELNRQALAS